MKQEKNSLFEHNAVYLGLRPFFDLGQRVFELANQCIDDLRTWHMDESLESHLRHVVTLLCFSSLKTLRSILFLCNQGHGEDAMNLTRTIFENYVVLKFIQKYPEDNIYRFMNYLVLQNKFRLDKSKSDDSTMSAEVRKLYSEREAEILEKYDAIRECYAGKNDDDKSLRERYGAGRWCGIDRRTMAIKVGLEEHYDCVFHFHSCFAHPHPLGLVDFCEESDVTKRFRPRASENGVFPALPTASRYFLLILKEWARLFDLPKEAEIDELFTEVVKIENNYLKLLDVVKCAKQKR